MLKRQGFFPILLLSSLSLGFSSAWAGVFDMPHFVDSGSFAVGLEPEAILSDGGGVGLNLKYTQGLNDLSNLTGILGTGTGVERFRVGGNLALDFFPDVDNQPGIGIAFQGLYYRFQSDGRLDATAIPYIHKSFTTAGNQEIEPFLAYPIGLAFQDGTYHTTETLAFGSMFKATVHVRYVLEMGVAINHAETYLSGGIVYYP
jgi:hypothetical protein